MTHTDDDPHQMTEKILKYEASKFNIDTSVDDLDNIASQLDQKYKEITAGALSTQDYILMLLNNPHSGTDAVQQKSKIIYQKLQRELRDA